MEGVEQNPSPPNVTPSKPEINYSNMSFNSPFFKAVSGIKWGKIQRDTRDGLLEVVMIIRRDAPWECAEKLHISNGRRILSSDSVY